MLMASTIDTLLYPARAPLYTRLRAMQQKAQEALIQATQKALEEAMLYRIALSKSQPDEREVLKKMIYTHTFQEVLRKIEKLLELKEVWCYSSYNIAELGNTPATVIEDENGLLWPAFTVARDHTGCPGYLEVVNRKQLMVWLLWVVRYLLSRH